MTTEKKQKLTMQVKDITDADLDGLRVCVRNAVVMFCKNGWTYKQVAEGQCIPIGTVKSRINRARSKIIAKRARAAA